MFMTPDPITLEVLRNRFDSAAAEIQATLLRSSYSVILKEGEDCSAGLFNARGEIVAQSTALPQHMGAFIPAIARILREFPPGKMHEDDVYCMNDPHDGGTHLPDLIVVVPVIAHGRVIAFSAALAHMEDIGGKVPGSMPTDSTEIWQEGLILGPLKLYNAGQPNRTLISIIERNVRLPKYVLGDISAEVAAATVGAKRVREMLAEYGAQTLTVYMDHLLDYAERLTRARIAEIPDGVYRFTDYMDNDGIDLSRRVPIAVTLTVAGTSVVVDYAGTNPQVKGPINAPLSGAQAAAYYALRCVTDAQLPNNHGCYRPVEVRVPRGCLLNPHPGAPVAIRAHTLKRAADTVMGALAQAVPGRVTAAPAGSISAVSFGGVRADTSERFGLSDLIGGGGGARPADDGIEAIDTDVSNCMNVPAEAIEIAYPLRVLYYRLRRDGGGAGRTRGGTGIERAIEITAGEIVASYRSERHFTSPWGLFGGRAGRRWSTMVRRANGPTETIPSKARIQLGKGDVLEIVTGGGGGYGDPRERPAEQVLADILDGKVSADAARDEYGVRLDEAGRMVHTEKTARLRATMARHNPADPIFDRGETD